MSRCSICDAKDSNFSFGHYHCKYCEDIIRQTTGDLQEKDIEEIILGEDNDFDYSVDTAAYYEEFDTDD